MTHDLSLSKECFVKKLAAFEKGTTYYTIAHLSISNMSMIFKTINKANVDFDQETVTNMLSEIQRNLKDVYALSQDIALSLPLYTDLKLPDSDEEFTEKYIELLGEISFIGNVIKLADEKIGNESVIQEINRLEGIRNIQVKKLGEKIESLYNLSKIIKEKYKGITTSLRNQLSVYDI